MRRTVAWKKAVAVAAAVGLLLVLGKYIAHSQGMSERDKMAEELAEEYIDEAAAIAHHAHETKISVNAKSLKKASTRLSLRAPVTAVKMGGEDKEETKTRKATVKLAYATTIPSSEEEVEPEGRPILRNTKHVSRLKGGPSLPQDVINRVEKFVFFIGYQRSGHSIIGSFMDAHPHMVIAHEFMLFTKWKEMEEEFELNGVANPLRNKKTLFDSLNRDSLADAEHGWRSGQLRNKNYTLTIDSQWQGRYDRFIRVIGDKSGGATTTVYTSSPQKFERYLAQIKETVGIPIRVLHVVRNPFDMVATDALYSAGKLLREKTGVKQAVFVSNLKKNLSDLRAAGNLEEFKALRINNQTLLESRTKSITRLAKGNAKIIQLIGEENVLELHNSDLVREPIATLNRICVFLNVDCSHDYLKTCADKVFRTISSTRELVVWQPSTKKKVEELIRQHSFFRRYSFDSE